MSLFKGRLDSGNKFTASDDVTGLEILKGYDADGTAIPAYVQLESPGGTDNFMFWDDSGNLRLDTSAPDSGFATAGTVIVGSSNAGANRTLSNLGTVAFNTNLLPTADSYTCGGASNYFTAMYATDWYGTSTSYVKATAGNLVVTGIVTFGASGGDAGNADIVWNAHSDTNFITFDEDDECMRFEDDTYLKFGTSKDVVMYSDATNLLIDGEADDRKIIFGTSHDLDVQFVSHDQSVKDCGWISDKFTWQLTDGAILQIGGADFDDVAVGFKFIFDGTATLNIDAITAEDSMTIGESGHTDFELHGLNYDILWDASENELIYADNVEVCWGAAKDLQIEAIHPLINFTLGDTDTGMVVIAKAAQTVASMHFDGATNTWNGANDVGMLHLSADATMADAGASLLYVTTSGTKIIASAEGFLARFVDTATVSDTPPAYAVQISSTNNFGLNIVTGVATATNLTMSGVVDQSVAMINVVGTTGNGWNGASGVGMVNIAGKGAHGDAAAPLLHLSDVTGASIASGRGTCLRITDSTTVGSDSWVAYINTTKNDGLLINTGDAAGINLKLTGLAAQTAPMMLIDASTGTGWDGADDVGALEIMSDSILVADGATLLRVESSATQKDGAEGYLARFENTGTARQDAVAVEIVAKSEIEVALNVGAGMVRIEDGLQVGEFAMTANTGGDGTAIIPAGTTFINVTCGTAAHIIRLPVPVLGNIIYLKANSSTDFQLGTQATTQKINTTTCTTGLELTCADESLIIAVCIVAGSSGEWIVTSITDAGVVTNGGTPA